MATEDVRNECPQCGEALGGHANVAFIRQSVTD
jgi:hypothetical protein